MTMLSDTKLECYYDTHEGRKAKFSFPFTNKEEYLQFITEWREEYAKLSQEIRELRLSLKNSAIGTDEMSIIQSKKFYRSCDARKMMEMRMAAKEYGIRLKKIALKKAA